MGKRLSGCSIRKVAGSCRFATFEADRSGLEPDGSSATAWPALRTALSRPGWEHLVDEPARRRFGFEVELGQAALQEYPRALCGVGTPEVSLERDQPTVGVLADRIELDAALERGERRLAATGLGLELEPVG